MKATRHLPGWITNSPEGPVVRFYAQPKASRSKIGGEHGEGEAMRLKVRIAAPPVDGAANEELFRFLKKLTGVPLSSIHLIRGESGKSKDVLFQGISAEDLIAKLTGK